MADIDAVFLARLQFAFTIGFHIVLVGLGMSVFPNIVPPGVSIYDAAAPPQSQAFLLVGTAVLLPMILIYTGYAYYVFRGKVAAGMSYH